MQKPHLHDMPKDCCIIFHIQKMVLQEFLTTEKFFHKDSNGNIWACTGDMGYVAEDGSVFIDGRISSSYENNLGETVYLFDVERAILYADLVRQCKVVVSEINGVKTHVAHIVLAANENTENALEIIRECCRTRLKDDHMPKLVKIHDTALPVALSGKLDAAKMEKDISNLVAI